MISNFENSTSIPQDILQWPTTVNKQTFQEQSIIYPIIQIPTQQYWQAQDTLNWPLSVRNLSKVAATWDYNDLINLPVIWWLYFQWDSSRSSWSIGNQAITWIWFKPKMIIIHAWGWGSGSNAICDWHYNWTSNHVRTFYFNGWVSVVTWQTLLIYIQAWANDAEATWVSLDLDWFTINWSNILVNVDFTFECFG